MWDMELLKQYYTTVFAVSYSPCGKYLAAANSHGKIAVFNLSLFLSCDDETYPNEENLKPIYKFQAHNSPIYSLISTDQFLVSGSVGEICAWKWSNMKRKEAEKVWRIQIPQGENLTQPEVNALLYSAKENEELLFAGCGDSKIYCYDMETRNLKLVFEGHEDYINCLALGNNSQECLSGSEDGTVRLWDTRRGGKASFVIEPYKQKMCNRPPLGKWIGCVAFDANDDWLVCGGAPILTIWHMRSLSPSTQLPKPDVTSHVVTFHEDMIVSAGSEPYINHWSFDGELKAEVPASASSIYSIGINSSPTNKVLCAAGNNHKIDICTNFMYRDFSLVFV